MKKHTIYTYIYAVLALAVAVVLQPLCKAESYRMYTVKSGLSENTVRHTMQDNEGYIWFATKDGLNRFNGRTFSHYACSSSPQDQNEFAPLNILALLQHKDGKRIWVATRDRILLFDPESGKFSLTPGMAVSGISGQALCYDPLGRLWIGFGNGLMLYDEEKGETKVYRHIPKDEQSLPSNSVTSLFCDSRGDIWIGTGNGPARYNPTKDNFIRLHKSWQPGNTVLCFSEDINGMIWIGTWYSGIARINPANGQFRFYGEGEGIPRVRDILQKDSESMYICSDIGFFLFDKTGQEFQRQTFAPELINNSIYSCCRDREGSLWIGTYFSGVCYLSPKNDYIECYTPKTDPQNFSGGAVSEFTEDESGKIWIATENGGLSLFDPDKKKFIATPYHQKDDNIHALTIAGDDLWVGTFSKGLRRINLRTGETKTYLEQNSKTPIPNNHIYALHNGKDGNIYIGTMHGASVYHPDTDIFTHIDSLKRFFIYDIAEDSYGNIWFADNEHGLHRLSTADGGWRHYSHNEADSTSLCNDRVIRLHIDNKQQLWICTQGGGVCRYDYDKDCFTRPVTDSMGQGFPGSVVFGVLDDAGGRLWFSTNHGIVCYNPENKNFKRYTYEDGLQSNQFNYRSSFRSSDGKFWFGGIDGFNTFHPHEIMDNSVPPTVVARVQMRDRNGDITHSESVSDYLELEISNNISEFSLHFECLSFVAPDKNHFAYKFNNRGEWITSLQPSISFPDPSYGKYEIRVRAINGDGYWSSNECRIVLRVKPPFYLSVPAILIYVMIVCGIGAAVIWRLRRRLDEVEVEEEAPKYVMTEEETDSSFIMYNPEEISEKDAKWLEKINRIIQEHLTDAEFNVEQLAKSLFMGRSNFQKKFKGITGMPPNAYIRLYRLKQAAEIIRKGERAINEVCYLTGFCNPSYFSRCFKEQFGILPKDFAKSLEAQNEQIE